MRKFINLIFLLLASAAFSTIIAQPPGSGAPAGGSDSNLRDDNIRLRSVELERIKREAAKQDPGKVFGINSKIETKFPEIKEDYEGIQVSQEAIVKAYTMAKTIDYKLIASAAREINKDGKRLDSNLFSTRFEVEEDKASEKEGRKKPDLKQLIVELDNAIGNFVASKLFQNLKVVDAETAKKTRIDLLHVIHASEALVKEIENMP
ncbi:MAG: hypothetical protein HOP17_05945 [Acidobacteria bacterium]|nr:hypothetical protein [Acidobacteriota bacterium]